MKPRIIVITLGVDDFERALRFYRDGLGLKTEDIVGREFEYGAVAFFELQGGSRLALWPRKSIARDTGLAVSAASPTDFTLGHNVASKAEVNVVLRQAATAGATIVKAAHDTFWGGYAGYSKDPDGHLWEASSFASALRATTQPSLLESTQLADQRSREQTGLRSWRKSYCNQLRRTRCKCSLRTVPIDRIRER